MLCGLTETDWSPDTNTIQDFEQLLGEDGVKLINEHVVKWAVEEKLADPTVVVADTTAQEAAIPYPNEMNMMATFVSAVAAASKHVGTALQGFVKRAGSLFQLAKKKLREFRLFAKDKAKAVPAVVRSKTPSPIVQGLYPGSCWPPNLLAGRTRSCGCLRAAAAVRVDLARGPAAVVPSTSLSRRHRGPRDDVSSPDRARRRPASDAAPPPRSQPACGASCSGYCVLA